MEHQKIESGTLSMIIQNQIMLQHEIAFNTDILKANLCDYNDAYILVTDNITVVEAPETQPAFKNCALFTKCKTKIDGTTIDDAEDIDLFLAMYNSIEYSWDYLEITGSLCFYSKDETITFNGNVVHYNKVLSVSK